MEPTAIALIGPSGSGKSSIGLSLAAKTAWVYIDSDREIEASCGMAVAQIFDTHGERSFREKESSCLKKLSASRRKNFILSTGGGMPVFNDNFDALNSIATLVYLNAPLEVLVTRIKMGEERPLLSGADNIRNTGADNQLSLRLGKLIAERESIYNRARYKIDTSSSSPEDLADDIIRMIGLVLPAR